MTRKHLLIGLGFFSIFRISRTQLYSFQYFLIYKQKYAKNLGEKRLFKTITNTSQNCPQKVKKSFWELKLGGSSYFNVLDMYTKFQQHRPFLFHIYFFRHNLFSSYRTILPKNNHSDILEFDKRMNKSVSRI